MAKIDDAARVLVDLFVWQPDEETGEVTPHLDRTFPDFSKALTDLRDALLTNQAGEKP